MARVTSGSATGGHRNRRIDFDGRFGAPRPPEEVLLALEDSDFPVNRCVLQTPLLSLEGIHAYITKVTFFSF